MKFLPLEPSMDLDSLRRFVREKIMPGVEKRDQYGEFPIDIFRGLHDLGWLQAAIPKEFGGSGASTTDLLWMAREISYGSAGVFTSFLGNLLGLTAITLFAPPALKRRLCEDYVDAFSLYSFCMTEPDAGTDVANISTTATRVKGGYLITGKKCFITNASYSQHLVVFARIQDPSAKRPKITTFYIPGETAGVSRGKILEKLGQRESNTSEIYFDNVFVAEEHLLGNEGDGFDILKRCIQRSKTLIAGAGVGVSTRAGEIVTAHLAQRVHYGTTLLKLPTIQSQLALLYTEMEASWLLGCMAAAKWDTGDLAIKEASMAKLYASDMATRFVSEALELFGGYGYSNEFEIQRLFRDVRAFEIFEGASLVQLSLIAKELFHSHSSAVKKVA